MAEKPTSSSCTILELDSYQDLLSLHINHPERYPFLLESVAHGTAHSRYDILFAFPEASIQLNCQGTVETSNVEINSVELENRQFLECLDEWWLQNKIDAGSGAPDHLPFIGGWFVYLGYELAAEIESTLDLPEDNSGLPVAAAIRCPAAVIRDHSRKCTWLVTEDGRKSLLKQMEQDIIASEHLRKEEDSIKTEQVLESLVEEEAEIYLNEILKIKQYITEGDVFQVNLSRQWQATLDTTIEPSDIYRRLRMQNPAPFAAMVRLNDDFILSSSPERLVQVGHNDSGQMIVQTRPIAGTRPRSTEVDKDQAFSRELLSHPKEQAEHIMLIDLERNDLGRVCVPGSIEVDELMTLESFAHVHHIVSNVRGQLRPDVTPGEVIRAVFPGGTITGCPKVRCMEIIAEQEKTGRGAYTGSVGYINRNGELDFNILIRTLVQKGKQLVFRTGAGIVTDSIAERELEETRAKARGLLLALDIEK